MGILLEITVFRQIMLRPLPPTLPSAAAHPKVAIGWRRSGNKHGVAIGLYINIASVVFCGTLRLDFFSMPQTVADARASCSIAAPTIGARSIAWD